MKTITLKKDKGVVGLNILLSVVVLLFIIGFLVMIFALMGGELEGSAWKEATLSWVGADVTTATPVNETGAFLSVAGQVYRDTGVFHNFRTFSVTNCTNNTLGAGSAVEIVQDGNYSVAQSGRITYTSTTATSIYNNSHFNCTGSFIYDANSTASQTIEKSTDELAGVTDWFGIIIVLTAMVILILLTVIIIATIRGTGLIDAGGSGGGSFKGSGKIPGTTA